jgi:predicted glycoside hydrolase/deacetylase ChbG (UPF0249 family)
LIRLVLNADDLGLAPALTRRVLDLRSRGHVSDVSVLAGGRAAREALDGLVARRVVAAGVHLSLVGGDRPLAPAEKVPSLLSGGVFRGHWSRVLAALAAGRIRAAEIEREWEAQVAHVAARGLAISHLDSHQHLHLHPALFPVAVRIAKTFRVPFLRAPHAADPASASGGSPAVRASARLLGLLGGRGRALLEEAGLREPPRVLGLAEAGRMTEKSLVRLVGTLPAGDYEVVLHPGDEDDVTMSTYRWGYAWREESDALASPAVAAAVAAAGAHVVSFAELAS